MLDASAHAEVLAGVLLAPLAVALQAHLVDDRNIEVAASATRSGASRPTWSAHTSAEDCAALALR